MSIVREEVPREVHLEWGVTMRKISVVQVGCKIIVNFASKDLQR